ncbi:type I restriction-modification system subunit M [Spirosoma arcticum]
MKDFKAKAKFLWDIADLLRGHYSQADYGTVILPLTVIRRLDMVLEPTKAAVLTDYERLRDKSPDVLERMLNSRTKLKFHNRSNFSFSDLANDADNIGDNFRNYLNGFSAEVRQIIEYFSFNDQIRKLEEFDLLYLVIKRFASQDATNKVFKKITSLEMGYVFEELIRKFAEASNATAGEHFTPREVIRLMVNLLFADDKDVLTTPGIVKTIYDPACGTGGMLSVAEEYVVNPLDGLNPDAKLELFGQEINPESYAICKSDMLIKGHKAENIKFGNTLTQDGLTGVQFDYMLSNPPFGVDWKKVEKKIRDEHASQGWSGRFGAGLPPISDGSLLFLQHMVSKMKRNTGGSRIAVVFNGSPLFSGGAGSGPSEIRRWLLENDLLEAIVALPDQLFYNTGIATYIWIVTDRKKPERRGKVQLINASGSQFDDKNNPFYVKMPKSLGNKRKKISEPDEDDLTAKPQISDITRLYDEFEEGRFCKIFNNTDFGYRRITIERPLRLRFQVRELTDDELTALLFNKSLLEADVLEWVNALRTEFGTDAYYDFNEVRRRVKSMLKSPALKDSEIMTVVSLLCQVDPEAAEVRKERSKPDDRTAGPPSPFEVDANLRDYENVPLRENIYDYFKREVLPHVPDAWIDTDKKKRDERDGEVGIVGYEVNFTRYFYEYKAPRSLTEIKAAILALEEKTAGMIRQIL